MFCPQEQSGHGGMIQSRTTGSTISCLWPALPDHAVLLVTMPRKSDSDMGPDGSPPAIMRIEHAVEEPGGLHGVSDLEPLPEPRRLASNSVELPATEERWKWRNLAKTEDQIGRQDKAKFLRLAVPT